VAGSRTLAEVLRKLGLQPTGGNYRYINGRIRHLQLDTSHFGGRIAARIRALTHGELKPLVAASNQSQMDIYGRRPSRASEACGVL